MVQPRKALQITTMLAFLLGSTALLQADLIKNGDFSDDISYDPADIADNWVATVQPADSGLIEQTTPPPPRSIVFTMFSDAPDGSMLKLEQEVSLAPGTYRLGFQFTANSEASESDYFEVFADGLTPAEKVLADNHQHPMDVFNKYDYLDFTAGSNPVLLGFQFVRAGDSAVEVEASARLDYVELSVVPVPSAAILGSIGLGYAGWRLRRRDMAKA